MASISRYTDILNIFDLNDSLFRKFLFLKYFLVLLHFVFINKSINLSIDNYTYKT